MKTIYFDETIKELISKISEVVFENCNNTISVLKENVSVFVDYKDVHCEEVQIEYGIEIKKESDITKFVFFQDGDGMLYSKIACNRRKATLDLCMCLAIKIISGISRLDNIDIPIRNGISEEFINYSDEIMKKRREE